MKINFFSRAAILSLAVSTVLLSGCRNYMVPEEGALSLESARMSFSGDASKETLWKGKDLDIKYTVFQRNSEMTISGSVIIHDSVLMSFNRVEQLVVKFNFLDGSGRVIGTADITPHYFTYGTADGPLDFKTVTAFIPGASSFAFSYFGTLFERADEVSVSWEISYFPFTYES